MAFINVIEFVTIASTGDSTDFGDLSAVRGNAAGVSSATRGIAGGGRTPPACRFCCASSRSSD